MSSRDDDERDEGGQRDTVPGPRASGRVLVADDDAAMRDLVSSALLADGYEVDVVSTGSDLLRAIASSTLDAWPLDGVDLVVSDLRMPGVNGLEVIRRLHAARSLPPMILMTAFAEPDVLATAQRFGVPVLSKPFALETLTQTAAAILARPAPDVARDSRSGFRWW